MTDPRILVASDTRDDAAVYLLDDATALVQTIDVFMPIVDDPFAFGEISAANSLSDIYAMGAEPLFALAFAGFPRGKLPLDMLAEILRGGAAKCAEAGIAIAGGHTLDDTEPKYGLVVTGKVHPDRVVRNSTARPGDALVLTKPLGIGVLSSAIKKDVLGLEDTARAIVQMATLNRAAAAAMVEVGVSAATDVTGFGLLGHLHEMVHASGLRAHVRAADVPVLAPARELVKDGIFPGGSQRNLDYFGKWTRWGAGIDEATQKLLADAQTSGGLLMAVPAPRLDALLAALAARGVATRAVIGELSAGEPGTIEIA